MSTYTSNVPEITWKTTGPVIPEESKILAGAQADIDAAFGGGVNSALETPQGQIATTLTAIIGDKNNQVANLVNQVNPDYASGSWQDAIARIYFIDRNPATSTTVTCDCVGLAGKTIAAGAKAVDTNGYVYACVSGGTIPANGTISLEFANVETGAIACAAGTLTGIYQAVDGWDTINNPADGVLGSAVETRAAFETRRQNMVALNAHGSLASIYAAVLAVDGVTDAYAYENCTSAAITVGGTGYSLAPHSLYIAAVGGTDAEIAAAIWQKKNDGSAMNGNTTVTVSDTANYSVPYPEYSIIFNRPTSTPIKFAITIAASDYLPSDVSTQIKAAIISAFAGGDGGARARIGATIYATRYIAPVLAVDSNIRVVSLLIGTSTATLNDVTMGIDQAPAVSADDITVTIA